MSPADGAVARAQSLLDPGSAWLLPLSPAAATSPWLAAQAIPSPPGDGIAVALGSRGGRIALSAATDANALGGSLGEVGGAVLAAALRTAHQRATATGPWRHANPCTPLVLLQLDGGGVRLQEGAAALLAAADVLAAAAALAQVAHLVAILPGSRGCYGAWALLAGLCHTRLAVRGGRLGLSGPRVIAQLGAPGALDSNDAHAVDAMHGSAARLALGLIDAEVDADGLQAALDMHIAAEPPARRRPCPQPPPEPPAPPWRDTPAGRLLAALVGDAAVQATPGALAAPLQLGQHPAWLLASHHGDAGMGLLQAHSLAAAVRARTAAGAAADHGARPALVLLVDAPGQAMCPAQEALGLHQALSDLQLAYAHAAQAGWAIVALVLGRAVSGAFLCHGLGAHRLLALAGPQVQICAMAGPGIVAVTGGAQPQRGAGLDPRATDSLTFARLGGIDVLLPITPAAAATPSGAAALAAALAAQVRLCAPQAPGASPRNAALRPATGEIWRQLAAAAAPVGHAWAQPLPRP